MVTKKLADFRHTKGNTTLAESKKHGFSLSKYIGEDYQNTAYSLESLVEQE